MKEHGIEHVIPCKVQTLSTKTCFIKYFGVADTPTHLSILAATSIPISQIVKETMMDVFHVASAPDHINERDLFYIRTGWFPKPAAVDDYNGVNFKELLRIPQMQNEEFYKIRAAMKDVFENSIKMVNSHPYSLRCLVNGTAAAKKAQAFCSLQTEAAVKEYALVFRRLIFFAFNLRREKVAKVLLSEDVSHVVGQLLGSSLSENITLTKTCTRTTGR